MHSVRLSIIIPTHKRTDILRLCLECIALQTLKDLEVIVVSDGPDPKTAEMIQMLEWPFAIQYFAIPKSQQGVARNRAVEKARGKYALLIGDDIFLNPRACEIHLKAHEKLRAVSGERSAVLGFTTWDPAIPVTPLMRWMERSGIQFGYPKIAAYAHGFIPAHRQHWFTYTSNLSLPSKLLWQIPFREDTVLYGWEDVEWGKRLAENGVGLFYEPDAKGFHHHLFTDAEVWERSWKLGVSAVALEGPVFVGAAREPPLQLVPRGWKRIAYYCIALLPTYRGRHCRAFLRGMRDGSTSSP